MTFDWQPQTQVKALLLMVVLVVSVSAIGVAGVAAQFSADGGPTLEQPTGDAVVVEAVEGADRSLAGQASAPVVNTRDGVTPDVSPSKSNSLAGRDSLSEDITTGAHFPAEQGVFKYIFTTSDSQTAPIAASTNITVTVVDGSGEGGNVLSVFESELPDGFITQVVGAGNVDDSVINATDVFVFNDLSGATGSVANQPATANRAGTGGDAGNVSPDATELITTVENDFRTGAVYLDQLSDSESFAIPARSDIIGDPTETFGTSNTSGSNPVEYEIKTDHPIFDGVGIAGDTVPLYSTSDTFHSWFTGASGETLAEVQTQAGSGGPAVTVDSSSGSVLLSSLGIAPFFGNPTPEPGEFTDEASQILANAVEVAAPPDDSSAFFQVTGVTAPAEGVSSGMINVTTTIINIGGLTGTQDIVFELDGQEVATEPGVTIAPGENATIEFTGIQLPNQPGTYEQGVLTANDSQTAEITVLDPAFFAVSNLTAPAEAGPGETINVSATITNTGNLTGTQDVVFEFDGQEVGTEPAVQIDSGETTVAEFSPVLPEQPNTYEHGVFTANDSQTAQIIIEEVGPPSLPGFDDAPQDSDNDGLYEDIDGDGSFDIFDVQALFNGLDSDAVQNNPEAFNFNEDDNPEEVTIFDVQGLFNRL